MPPLSPRDSRASGRLMRRLEGAFAELNPVLVALAIGLAILDLTCFAALGLPVARIGACISGQAHPTNNLRR